MLPLPMLWCPQDLPEDEVPSSIDRLLHYDDDLDASPVMLITVQLVEAAALRWAETVTVRSTPAAVWATQVMPMWMQRLYDTLVAPSTPLLVKQFVCKVRYVQFWRTRTSQDVTTCSCVQIHPFFFFSFFFPLK